MKFVFIWINNVVNVTVWINNIVNVTIWINNVVIVTVWITYVKECHPCTNKWEDRFCMD